MALTAAANVEVTSNARWSHIRGLLSGFTSFPNGKKQMKRAEFSSKRRPTTNVFNMVVCNSVSIPIPDRELNVTGQLNSSLKVNSERVGTSDFPHSILVLIRTSRILQ